MSLFQISPKDIPINTNKQVQTIGNTILGGLKNGLLIVVYHSLTELFVAIEPKKPTNKHKLILVVILSVFVVVLFIRNACI